ncbi:RNA polymerase sigma factor [Candidatus Poribacteria bacterium]|nr:RNA polymerase sigma factor [Candidatus Poribacteria bacterium]
MTDATDETLVKQALAGDDAAFGSLVLRHQRAIYRFAQSYLGNSADAEDLTQEAFIEAYTNLRTLQEPAKFGSWLRGITRHLCVSWLRRQTSSLSYEEVMEDGHFEVQMIETFGVSKRIPTPDELLEQKEVRQTVLAAIDSLSEKNRTVTTLHYLDGMSYQEIAQSLDVPVSTIEGRLYRARKQLQEVITMTKEVRDKSKIDESTVQSMIESATQDMRNQIAEMRGQIEALQGRLNLKEEFDETGAAYERLMRLPDDEEAIAWNIVGAYCSKLTGKTRRWSGYSDNLDNYLNLAPDAKIANLAANFTNPITVAVFKRLVKGASSVAELAKQCNVSEDELNQVLDPLIATHLVARKEEGVVDAMHSIILILTLVNMTALYLSHIKSKE